MIIPPPPQTNTDKLEEERNVFEESVIHEPEYNFIVDRSHGIQTEDDQYIIDPDYQELLGIDNFEDLIKTRR